MFGVYHFLVIPRGDVDWASPVLRLIGGDSYVRVACAKTLQSFGTKASNQVPRVVFSASQLDQNGGEIQEIVPPQMSSWSKKG